MGQLHRAHFNPTRLVVMFERVGVGVACKSEYEVMLRMKGEAALEVGVDVWSGGAGVVAL